jgi:tetratricopeptide (TPR) repeat protein
MEGGHAHWKLISVHFSEFDTQKHYHLYWSRRAMSGYLEDRLLMIFLIFFTPFLPVACSQRNNEGPENAMDLAEAANSRAIKFYKAAEFKHAVGELDDAIRLNPTKAEYYFNRANSKGGLYDWNDAINDFDRAIEMDPGAAKYYSSRGYAYYKVGKFDKSIQDQMEVIRLEPKNSNGYYNLARIYGTCKDGRYRDGKKAVENGRKACELTDWKTDMTLAMLAAAYAEKGDFQSAIEWQQKALDIAPLYLTEEFETRMNLYKKGQPFRDDWSKKDFH